MRRTERRDEFFLPQRAITEGELHVRVVVTVRADMFDRPSSTRLGHLVGDGAFVAVAAVAGQLDDAMVLPPPGPR